MNESLATLLTVTVYALAVARLVRLVNYDTILDPIRIAIARRGRDENRSPAEQARWNTLLHWAGCPWCVSIWVAAGTAWLPIWFADNPVARYLGVLLAVSMVVGLAAPLSADDEIGFEMVENP